MEKKEANAEKILRKKEGKNVSIKSRKQSEKQRKMPAKKRKQIKVQRRK